MATLRLVFKYSLFAAIATLLNLLAQETSIRLYAGDSGIALSIAAGTLAGWVSKYLLDKHYIFAVQSTSLRHDANNFVRYGLTGVLTTLLFWGFELSFHFYFGSKTARYAGAIIGLAIGYGVKYQLDKRFVFNERDV